MTWISVDVEADGPIPGDYSMIALGACVVDGVFEKRFLGYLRPISDRWEEEALAISGFSRSDTLLFPQAIDTMQSFASWLDQFPKPLWFWADNNGFDWQFVNWYFHHFLDFNPFGFSSKNINSLYHGVKRDTRASFKHLRVTKHDHNPANDAAGNAEALWRIVQDHNIKAKL